MNSNGIKAGIAVGAALAVTGSFFAGFKLGRKKGNEEAWAYTEKQLDEQEDRLKRQYKIEQYSSPDFATEENDVVLPRKTTPATYSPIDPEQLEKLKEHINSQGYASLGVTEEGYVQATIEMVDAAEASLFERYENEDIIEETVEGVAEVTPNMDDPEPYGISEAEFEHDAEDYAKISLSFYPDDNVVCDPQQRVVDDVESAIGYNNLKLFSPSVTVVHVRNNRLQADFEIALELGSYRANVLGMDDSPAMERPRRKKVLKDD